MWDFPTGTLYKREYAAYLVSKALTWDFVPCTVIRDGPFGVGSVQQFIDADSESNYFTLIVERRDEMERIALFDLLANNADRKATASRTGVTRFGRLTTASPSTRSPS